MIITVTINPAIDKTIEVDQLNYKGLNRLPEAILDAGGKGINVSKTIKSLGGHSLACGILGSEGSDTITQCLKDHKIPTDFLIVKGRTRTNTKIVEKDGGLTELNEQGMRITEEVIIQLEKKLINYASPENLFVLSGSVPDKIDKNIYGRLCKSLKEKGAQVFVDADGELFKRSLGEIPTIVKPNHVELAEYFGCEHKLDLKEILQYGKRLIEMGISLVAVSRGNEGAVFLFQDQVIISKGLKVNVRSTVGAGDAMVAALCYGLYEKKMTREEAIIYATAVSAGAVMTVGTKPPEQEVVLDLMKQVKIKIREDKDEN